MKTTIQWACMLLSVACVGCGSGVDDRPETAPVVGQLMKAGVPVADAQIEFIPESGAASTATTDSEGKFKLIYVDGQPGAKVGVHQVRITIGAAPMGTADGDAPPPKKGPPQPMLYIIPDRQTVSAGENDLKLELPAKGQRG